MEWTKPANSTFHRGWSIWESAVDGRKKFTLRLDMVRIMDFDTDKAAKEAVRLYEASQNISAG